MSTMAEFYRSLKVGDVITSVGCKGQTKNNEELLTKNKFSHHKWGRYARVAGVADGPPDIREGDIGIRLEGIDPCIDECMWNCVKANDTSKATLRKATNDERQVFMEEYLKTRYAVAEHSISEAKEKEERLEQEINRLKKIARTEHISTKTFIKRAK